LRADAGVAAVKNNYTRAAAFNGGLMGDLFVQSSKENTSWNKR